MSNDLIQREEKKKMNNSDILFIYDAKMCNPNGDPDDENKPRMDYDAQRNLVSDVRLKRYVRDWLESKGHEVFVAKVDGKIVDATKRLAWVLVNQAEKSGKGENKAVEELKKKLQGNQNISAKDILALEPKEQDILESLIDVRLFGGTMPIKDPKKGVSYTFIGPVQFNWGYSLNKAEIVTSSSISSTFAGRTREAEGAEGQEYGTFGKDWRVYYSLIAFHGIVSGKRAIETMLSEGDLKLLDNAVIKAIPQEATTRSKVGQTPRLYLRVEYVNDEIFLGDLRQRVQINSEEGLRDISEFELNVDSLVNLLKSDKDKIKNIYLWENQDLRLKGNSSLEAILNQDFKNIIVELPHQIKGTAEAES